MTQRLAAACVLACSAISAQSSSLVMDINAKGFPNNSNPSQRTPGRGNTDSKNRYVQLGNEWFFFATTARAGEELWKSDGTTSGTTIVKDIRPGPTGSITRQWMIAHNGKLFFAADDGVTGNELWCTDGTSTGTYLVKDISPAGDSNPTEFTGMGGHVYFQATNGVLGLEMWRTDGTGAGTTLVRDIAPGPNHSRPQHLCRNPAGNRIVFATSAGRGELWVTDGSLNGTRQVRSLSGPPVESPGSFQPLGSILLFDASSVNGGRELWRTDGTDAGTYLVKDIAPGPRGSAPDLRTAAAHNGALYFAANDGVIGAELWRTDGTNLGTSLVADINQGTPSASPRHLHWHNGILYFAARSGLLGEELWKWDGASASLVKDIYTTNKSDSSPSGFLSLGSKLLFSADQGVLGAGRELYTTDGTASGTVVVKDMSTGPKSSAPISLTRIGSNRALFSADESHPGGVGRELFETDGTQAGTKIVKDISGGSLRVESSNPYGITSIDGHSIYFSADDGVHGVALWRSDASGTGLVSDLAQYPSGFTACWDGRASYSVFIATDGTHGFELWKTDGTRAGTSMLKDIAVGTGSSFPTSITCCGGRVYFVADDGRFGEELWTTDGTPSGTQLLLDINPGSLDASPLALTCLGNRLYFSAFQNSTGRELWSTDGTRAGTKMVLELKPGSSSIQLYEMVAVGNRLVFFASQPGLVTGIYTSDGTATGTRRVTALTSAGLPRGLTRVGDRVFFAAHHLTYGDELFVTDLTAAGTVMVADLNPGRLSSTPQNLTAAGGKLYFDASVAGSGREPYVSDGTLAGTLQLADIHPGTRSSVPTNFIETADAVLFIANYPVIYGGEGAAIYTTDGTAAGTKLHHDIRPGIEDGKVRELTICRGVIYFTANDGTHGQELFRIDGTPGTVESLGEGCGVDHPRLESRSVRIGDTAVIKGSRSPSAPGVLLVGLPSQVYQTALFDPACGIRIDPSTISVLSQPSGSRWTKYVSVANDPTLVGLVVRVQSIYDTNPLSTSQTLQFVIGP